MLSVQYVLLKRPTFTSVDVLVIMMTIITIIIITITTTIIRPYCMHSVHKIRSIATDGVACDFIVRQLFKDSY